jgi:hypothetical protein
VSVPVPEETLLAIIRIQNEIVAAGLDSENVMSMVVSELHRLVPSATGATVELVDRQHLVYRAASGSAQRFIGLRLRMSGSLSGKCVRIKQALYAPDAQKDTRVDRDARKLGAHSMRCHPLIHRNECVGVFKAVSDRVNAF